MTTPRPADFPISLHFRRLGAGLSQATPRLAGLLQEHPAWYITVDDRRRMFVTHSGANNQVSVVDLDLAGFGASELVTVGDNPFGLAFVGP